MERVQADDVVLTADGHHRSIGREDDETRSGVGGHHQTVAQAPKRIHIWFSQVPVEAVSQMKLAGPDKAEVALGKVVADKADKSIYADLTAGLKAGAYVVSWRSAGDDGHVQTGDIKFTFTPKAGS